MSAAEGTRIHVSDHAMWQAAERFPRFDTALIEPEIRAAMREGRLVTDRRALGLEARYYDDVSLYAWTELPAGQLRVYALQVNRLDGGGSFAVMTTMRGRSLSS